MAFSGSFAADGSLPGLDAGRIYRVFRNGYGRAALPDVRW